MGASPIRIRNYIGGALREPASREYLDDFEPATGRVYALTPESDEADLADACVAACEAFAGWRATPSAERARLLDDLAARVEAEAEALARAESIDTGKPIRLARDVDIPRVSANLRFFAAAATQFASEAHAMEAGAINYTLRQPHGVVACISPWNLPLYLLSWKIAPALAAGNCVIAKPSELTPMTAWLFSKLCIEAGVPAGVLNILHGTGPRIGHALVTHPNVRAISFTGGTVTGRHIARDAGPLFKKLSLELGGKNPTIVFGDCDWEKMLATSLRSAFSNQGQVCLCGSRILVEAAVYERFCDEFVKRVRALRVGDPLNPDTEQGALVSKTHLEKVQGCVARAREEGGRILCGGAQLVLDDERCAHGWFMSPTVIEGLAPDCRTNQEEIFGPVVTVQPFVDEDEAVAQANCTPYGLAASLWSSDVRRCHRVAASLEAGIVWVNTWMLRDLRTPMGGTKASGIGREGGAEAMRFFTEPKNVCIDYA
ncbi:MAG TPA: aldehyde dehydrogenase [Gammaproteobacteria bacterium]|nr:aldehyde dehydrogenase [Gammaproteobacteria bacterium]